MKSYASLRIHALSELGSVGTESWNVQGQDGCGVDEVRRELLRVTFMGVGNDRRGDPESCCKFRSL